MSCAESNRRIDELLMQISQTFPPVKSEKNKDTKEPVMNEALKTSISKMAANGTRLELPKGDFFENYAEVKRVLEKAGGKYKKNGFEFGKPAQEIKDRLLGGEKIDDKKKYQFFETPATLVNELIQLAGVEPHHRALEPSAGQGRIADQLRRIAGECEVVEMMPGNAAELRKKNYAVKEGDFLGLGADVLGAFDRIVANPPFTNNQDIDHVLHMYSLLNPGGRIVSIMSPSWTFGGSKKQAAFREWLQEVGATVHQVDEGAFKESGTNIRTVIVVIDKVAESVAA